MTKAAGVGSHAGTGVHAKKGAGAAPNTAAGVFANITRRDFLALGALGLLGGGAAGVAGCSAAGGAGVGDEAARAVSGVEPIADTSGWDSAYYVPKYASFDEARLASEEVAREVEASGIVLLKNDGVLPLPADVHVSLLGRGAAEPVLGGTGAALIDKTHAVDAREALSAYFSVNDLAFDWLCEQAPNYPRAVVGALDKPETVSHYLSQDLLQSLESGVSDVFVPNAETANYAPGQHQLELCREELELLAAVKAACSKMVVLLNVATSMEVGPLVEPGGACEADAILQICFPGTVGLGAVADVLAGKVNPSGRTCDLWAADFAATPSFNNFGNHTYTDVTDYYTSIGSGAHFVEYEEGIYVGYRYYETADAEARAGNYPGFDYDSAVVFPFGFGLSYTEFDRRLEDVALDGD